MSTVKVTVAKVENGFVVISGTDSEWGPSDTTTSVFTDINGVTDFVKNYDFMYEKEEKEEKNKDD